MLGAMATTTKCMMWGMLTGACLLVAAMAAQSQSATTERKWSPEAAARYMNERQAWWESWDHAKRDHETHCVSCHTQVPFAMARPLLREELHEEGPSKAEKAMLADVEKRVRAWDTMLPFYDDATSGKGKEIESRNAEAVLNAIILANHDWRHISESTRLAMDHAWALQTKSGPDAGSWVWQNFGYGPWEADESQYHWTAMMAVAVERAQDGYGNSAAIVGNLSALRMYLRTHYDAQPLLNKIAVLWASAGVQGILTPAQRKSVQQEIYAAQSADGGWSLSKLGHWTRRDGTAQVADSDGYATAIAVLALKENRMDSSYLTRGLAWLETHQNPETGAWPAWSVNKQRDPASGVGKFMDDAATGYAVLALKTAGR
jgi:squalene-hopene/tetraprenyl-beta-curcumene cyclase